jgi:hypothetical protein
MVTDAPEQYQRHTEALAQQYLEVSRDFAATAGALKSSARGFHGLLREWKA